ncbi:hypothetical protein SAMN05216264_101513 [Pseudomonas marincola]|jgi:hypothetical protein|nr:hypothetical protein SAMN05216264_101513 [Pseudomonas marincola]
MPQLNASAERLMNKVVTACENQVACQYRSPELTGLMYAPYETGYLFQPNG